MTIDCEPTRSSRVSVGLKISVVALCFVSTLSLTSQPSAAEGVSDSVPKASCGRQDRTESVQGETTLAERFASGPAKAYNCNLELVGQFEGEGSAGYLNIFEDCVYYSTWDNPKMRHPGVPVLDVMDPSHPKVTIYLNSPAMLNANEFLEIDPTRKLLFANRLNTTLFETYDLSVDCRHPVLKYSTQVPGVTVHMGQFTSDYRTLYGGSCCKGPPHSSFDQQFPFDPSVPPSAVFAVDTSDPKHLRALATWIPPNPDWLTHAVSVNKDGSRAYVSISRAVGGDYGSGGSGMVILDVSEIRDRRPDPHFHVVGKLFWDDSTAQAFNPRVMINGHPYLIVTDMVGAIRSNKSLPAADPCRSGKPGWGFARIIDIGDEKNPGTVSKLMLEVHNPANCSRTLHDPTALFGYSSMACSADDENNAKLLACGYNEAGLRVFDVHDPAHPREIAYYKPPARRTESRLGSVVRTLHSPELRDHTADDVWFTKFRSNGDEISFMSSDGGFQIVRFSDRFQGSHSELFRHQIAGELR